MGSVNEGGWQEHWDSVALCPAGTHPDRVLPRHAEQQATRRVTGGLGACDESCRLWVQLSCIERISGVGMGRSVARASDYRLLAIARRRPHIDGFPQVLADLLGRPAAGASRLNRYPVHINCKPEYPVHSTS